MENSRRNFLKLSALLTAGLAVPAFAKPPAADWAVKGVDAGVQQSMVLAPSSEAWAAMVQRLATERRPAVAIVVSADPAQAQLLQAGLTRLLLQASEVEVHRVFCESIFICISVEQMKKLENVKEGQNVLLLSREGKVVAGAELPLDKMAGQFVAVMNLLTHGANGERLAELAKYQGSRCEKGVLRGFEQAVDELSNAEFKVREAESEYIYQLGVNMSAAVAAKLAVATDAEARVRLTNVFERWWMAADLKSPGVRLPYGVMFKEVVRDPCPGCGLGFAPPMSRDFMAALTRSTAPM